MAVTAALKEAAGKLTGSKKPSGIDQLLESHGELLLLIERNYERTGDLELKPIIQRAKDAARHARD
jgi:hypothetical protein